MTHRIQFEEMRGVPKQRGIQKGMALKLTMLFAMSFLLLPLFSEDINTTFFGNKAVDGYDAVAYFTEGKAIEGKAKFTYKYKGANWLFSSKENMELFKKSPEKYEPQYGGYCAWAIAAKESKYSVEGEYWAIVDGKLYLNYSKGVKKDWDKDRAGFIKKADEVWPKIADKG